jgi:F-type H+-transporting ATPase subunit b
MNAMKYLRITLAALVLTCGMSMTPRVFAQEPSAAAQEAGQGHESEGGGWLPVVAKAFNFAVLAGVLVYFLKSPLVSYMDGRIRKVREDLVSAAETRETASRQLAEIDAKLKALPGEIEQLKVRGAEDLAAERARIEAAAEAERQRLLEQTRREIEMRLQVARRELVEHAADLAVRVASTRIQQTITPDDQARLVDRYAAQIGGGSR